MAVVAKRGRGRPVRDLTNQRFGRLIVVGRAPDTVRTGTNVWWATWCDCGQTRYVPMRNLVKGNTTSCGCRRMEILHAGLPKYARGEIPNLLPPTRTADPASLPGQRIVAAGNGETHLKSPRSVAPNIGDGAMHDQQAGASEVAG